MSELAVRTVGAEEELLLFAANSPHPVPTGEQLAADPATDVEHELKLEQIEIATPPGRDLGELAARLRARRDEAIAAAAAHGARVAALATSPVPVRPTPTPGERYTRMVEQFGLIGVEQLTCGAHVHVGIGSRTEGIAVLDRIRVWLPVLVALSANSPFWNGRDSGYASYRSVAWGRWPSAGPTQVFGTEADYDAYAQALVDTGAVLDAAMLYFDARLSARYPTVEVRVADVGLEVHDTALLAALCRALVDTAAARARAGSPPPPVPAGTVRAASWVAARFGMGGELVDLLDGRRRPAWELVDRLVDDLGPALRSAGDQDAVHAGLERLRARGTGADVQRAAQRSRGRAADVVDRAVQLTAGGEPAGQPPPPPAAGPLG